MSQTDENADFAFRVIEDEGGWGWLLFEAGVSTDVGSTEIFPTRDGAANGARWFKEVTYPQSDPRRHAPVVLPEV